MEKKYSVITYVFGEYEKIREVLEVDEQAEYICVTDNENLKSDTWNIIVDHDLDGKGVFDKVFSVRYNPFKYCTTDVCVRIDGSIQVKKSLSPIVDSFIESGDDCCYMLHPYRNLIKLEYAIWAKYRAFPMENIAKHIAFLANMGYDFNTKGLIELTFSIVKRDFINDNINRMTYAAMKYLGDEKDIDRLDQTVISVIIDRFFRAANIFWVTEEIIHSDYLQWYGHNSDIEIPIYREKVIPPVFFNKEVKINLF